MVTCKEKEEIKRKKEGKNGDSYGKGGDKEKERKKEW